MVRLRKVISALVLLGSGGLALFGALGEQSEMYYFAAFLGLVVVSAIWPWAGSKGNKQKLDLGSSATDLPISDCRSRMNRGGSGSSNDETGIGFD